MNYDVFLSHNGKDKPAVEQIGRMLSQEYGLTCWLDKWNLSRANHGRRLWKRRSINARQSLFLWDLIPSAHGKMRRCAPCWRLVSTTKRGASFLYFYLARRIAGISNSRVFSAVSPGWIFATGWMIRMRYTGCLAAFRVFNRGLTQRLGMAK